jgi:hypothetical protein
MSNELSNYCDADRQAPLDNLGRFGAPGIGIDDHLACFTPKRSLVRTQYRPPLKPLSERGFDCASDRRPAVSNAGLTPAEADDMFRAMHEPANASGSAYHVPEHR